ncbi:hypothetical protein ABIQ69_03690 [Agromyces sp. G08B096]|uniref:Uncharacterized protein n=1 Tax=Agromyces sp. G08B096 TaxID=3156399 RepID=A0AAU7W999_9MICO
MGQGIARIVVTPRDAGVLMNTAESLALSHVLVTELPVTLGTVGAPARYDVAAVFTRRPTTTELRLLTEPSVEAKLVERGYPTVSLRAADRRLIIGSTSLTELSNGLGPLIGQILSDISSEAADEQGHRDAEAATLLQEEAARAAAIVHAAEQVDFRPHASQYH